MSQTNPVIYFEIPVHNIQRAEKFYSAVFGFSFEKEIIDDYEMLLFPFEDSKSGISGALAKGDVYKPTQDGVILYFKTENIEQTLKKAVEWGGKILYPVTLNEKYGFKVAEFEDSEGNRIALQQTSNF
ncbi:glyoxalase [Elizabethkingia meningoseptica]|uniref:VOC family protein n=1 Tax=Elizabethkingia meningoseptica TaxID=238 RepID=UPI000332C3A6|nr:VOC family protein [Elizabethkingia meningoseptica]AQX06781.1 glyoxalase [Elizabethkingia meningoseptica]AQX48828.1 glyoxalase [Elizabethkingia meningoseptica]EOR29903.1 Glyoxalase/bleomycin resistance protein/dioxygenase [Elizabethkingia meningoseptica ATCC 13253 = NBRC 12535]KUY14914.1 glyoxalase [Elizabethkingia meningoseptica]MEC4712883.1 VOC family protein [Elizabethkingia meningoseptica]